MNIILISNVNERPVTLQLSTRKQFTLLYLCALATCLAFAYLGYWYSDQGQPQPPQSLAVAPTQPKENELEAELLKQIQQQEVQANIDALTRKLGQVHGHITRLDALGHKLVQMAELDGDEFNFGSPPAIGGPELVDSGQCQPIHISGLEEAISNISTQILAREHQLIALEQLIMSRNLAAEITPSGHPVKAGWVSSKYGWRTNPFSGKKQFHKGIDFAGKRNSAILAAAGGLVTYSGHQNGYGYVLELSHGDNHSTRYAHNAKNLVGVGEAVKKGQIIALMGSSGRSTGPHVHFEVLKDGVQVNPIKFINQTK